MRKHSVLPLTIFFVLLSLVVFSFASTQFVRFTGESLGFVTIPVQRAVGAVFFRFAQNNEQRDLRLAVLSEKLEEKGEQREMQALRDQFETATPRPTDLLPARIVGFEGYIPGVVRPVAITIDRGSSDGVNPGQAVVYKDNLLGKIVKVTPSSSSVILLTNDDLSFTGQTLEGEASGVIRGGNKNIVMENIILSETINKGDIVVTKGDFTTQGLGFPPGLVVGEVISVEKKQSDLFQLAYVKSLVDTTSLSTVFVLIAL